MFVKRILLGVVLVAPLALGGCITTGGGVPNVNDPVIDQQIANVQSIAVKVCGFLPTVSTIVNIAATFSGVGPVAGAASQVANAICSAVNAAPVTKSISRRAPVGNMTFGTVRGVPVRGQVVR